jgi:hypothetical protein
LLEANKIIFVDTCRDCSGDIAKDCPVVDVTLANIPKTDTDVLYQLLTSMGLN